MKLMLLFVLLHAPVFAQTSANAGIGLSPPNDSRIYRTPEVDVKPEISNGMYTLALFTSQNLKMPDVNNKKVKIFVAFVVEIDGSISDIRFIHMSAKDVDEAKARSLTEKQKKHEAVQLETMKTESVRVLSQFKEKWKPALKDGKPVRCLFNYPINFSL